MARVFTQDFAKVLGLPGRKATEIVWGEKGVSGVTLRRVEIPVAVSGEPPRSWHVHNDFEECIYVLAGRGTTEADSGNFPIKAGDAIVIPPGEKHATRNTGDEILVLLCFFPTPDIRRGTSEPGASGMATPDADR